MAGIVTETVFPVKVSVLMPVWNSRRYVDEAIRSVLCQEGVSFELLVADDASTDGAWDRVRAYRTDPRVRVWRFSRQRGSARARNFLIARARGRYLSICDHDDWMLPGNLLRFSQVLDRQPKVGVVYSDPLVMGASGRLLERRSGAASLETVWDLLANPVRHPGSMMRKELVERVGGYRNLRVIHDYDLFLRLAEIARFRFLNDRPYYCWRRWPGSCTATPESRAAWLKVRLDAIQRRYGVRVRRRRLATSG